MATAAKTQTRPTAITLTTGQVVAATAVGVARWAHATSRGWQGTANQPASRHWLDALTGALAEQAVGQILDRAWDCRLGIDRTRPDVADYEVRAVWEWDAERRGRGPSLILRPTDPPDRIYILADVHLPRVHIWGWIRAWVGQMDRWVSEVRGRPPAWFVPAESLRPIEELWEQA